MKEAAKKATRGAARQKISRAVAPAPAKKERRPRRDRTRAEELMAELVRECETPDDVQALLRQLTKIGVEQAMQAELTEHLGYAKHDPAGDNSGNSRNGSSRKTIKGEYGEVKIEVPRDRNGSYEPRIIAKNQRRFKGFDKQIISMYARGMSTRQIGEHLKEIYAVDVSPDLISQVTDAIMEEVRIWQDRMLDPVYPIVFLDALFVKMRDSGHIRSKAVYMAIGVNMEGKKEILGLWVQKSEGAKFWLQVVTELRNRGVQDILIACVDGLKGFPEAIRSVFPETQVQLCIVHLIRNSLRFVSWKDRREVAADLKAVYRAVDSEEALRKLEEFAAKWNHRYPTIARAWREKWEDIIPFLAYPPDIRRAIYTTNAIESLNNGIKAATKTRGSFPNDEAAIKLVYLALRNLSRKWTMPIKEWGPALNQFAILFEGRVPIE